jgi:hypothetical protein
MNTYLVETTWHKAKKQIQKYLNKKPTSRIHITKVALLSYRRIVEYFSFIFYSSTRKATSGAEMDP